jgi:hypothetical protein
MRWKRSRIARQRIYATTSEKGILETLMMFINLAESLMQLPLK